MEIYSGKGAYVLVRSDGSWAFAHDLLPRAWVRVSGSGLTVYLRPWAQLPAGAIWVPTARAVGHPWRYDTMAPDIDRALPRGEGDEQLVLAGPVRCTADRARYEFSLLRGEAAREAAEQAIRKNLVARLLLEGQGPFVARAYDARVAISEISDWAAATWDGYRVMIGDYGSRTLVACGDWVAAGASFEEAWEALRKELSGG